MVDCRQRERERERERESDSCLDDRRSTTGYCILLHHRCCQNQSSCSFKYGVGVSCLCSCCCRFSVGKKLIQRIWVCICLLVLSFGAIISEQQTQSFFNEPNKNIEVDIHYVHDKELEKEIEVEHVPTDYQIADILTKALPVAKFSYFLWQAHWFSVSHEGGY